MHITSTSRINTVYLHNRPPQCWLDRTAACQDDDELISPHHLGTALVHYRTEPIKTTAVPEQITNHKSILHDLQHIRIWPVITMVAHLFGIRIDWQHCELTHMGNVRCAGLSSNPLLFLISEQYRALAQRPVGPTTQIIVEIYACIRDR